ncbi:MAG: dTMP kinase, partial [Candidatus Mariimomonas ferrooxydans]
YYASRAQHVREVIYPALIKNTIVITDRFSDSTIAYQGYARGLDLAIIKTLNDIVISDLKPYVTFILDIDVEEGLKRNRGARKKDRFEQETIEFHNRVRNGYVQIAKEETNRIKVINASGSAEEVNKKIIEILADLWH